MSKAEDIKAARIEQLMNDMGWSFVHFKGGSLMSGPGTHGFIPFNPRLFGLLVQKQKFGTSENMISDFAKTVKTVAPDWSDKDHLIAFGDQVWDTKALDFVDGKFEYVYSSEIKPNRNTKPAMKFLMELAQGKGDLANDYLQAMAPLLMHRKPTGVVWFVGNGANGKSSYISAVYRILGKHLCSLTTASLEDGKATPVLAGVLGNICREASEARVEDTERYKAIGTHEPFAVRQLYTQDNITVETNFHTIFNANNVPVFSDKTKGARRRTLVVPFKAHFADDPSFDDKTFTPEFLGGLVTLLMEAARKIRDNGYRYKWSDETLAAKQSYDSEVNSAEAFVDYLVESGIVGFYNYTMLKMNYENWCSHHGLIPLGVTALKRTISNDVRADRKTFRYEGKVVNRYQFAEAYDEELVWLDNNGYGVRNPEEAEQVEKAEHQQPRLGTDW